MGSRDAGRVWAAVGCAEPPAGEATHSEAEAEGGVVGNLEEEEVASGLEEDARVS